MSWWWRSTDPQNLKTFAIRSKSFVHATTFHQNIGPMWWCFELIGIMTLITLFFLRTVKLIDPRRLLHYQKLSPRHNKMFYCKSRCHGSVVLYLKNRIFASILNSIWHLHVACMNFSEFRLDNFMFDTSLKSGERWGHGVKFCRFSLTCWGCESCVMQDKHDAAYSGFVLWGLEPHDFKDIFN